MYEADSLLSLIKASYQGIGRPGRVLLGLSGGADSVALFHLLRRLALDEGFALFAAHVHHGLREAADEEAQFVSDLCHSAGIRLAVKHVKVARQGSLEAAAREARYAALEEARQAFDCPVIALAHHADDQAETMMLHLLHGAGPTGLAGMRPFDRGLWRPLLELRKEKLTDFLKANGLSWREDESNLDTRHQRNAIRLQLMPLMQSMQPRLPEMLGRTADILRYEEDYWAGFTRDWLAAHASFGPPAPFLMLAPALALHEAARRRLLRALCQAAGLTLDHEQTLRLVSLLDEAAGAMCNLPGGAQALRTGERLFLLAPGISRPLPLGQLVEGGDTISVLSQRFDADLLQGATLRYRQPGDRIAPLGAGGSLRLSEYMIDRKIDRPLRDSWPLLCLGSQVLWVIGVGMAQTAAVSDSTRQVRRLSYRGALPGQIIHHNMGEKQDAQGHGIVQGPDQGIDQQDGD